MIELTDDEIRRRLHSLFFMMGATMTEAQVANLIDSAKTVASLPGDHWTWEMVDRFLEEGGAERGAT